MNTPEVTLQIVIIHSDCLTLCETMRFHRGPVIQTCSSISSSLGAFGCLFSTVGLGSGLLENPFVAQRENLPLLPMHGEAQSSSQPLMWIRKDDAVCLSWLSYKIIAKKYPVLLLSSLTQSRYFTTYLALTYISSASILGVGLNNAFSWAKWLAARKKWFPAGFAFQSTVP